MANSRRSPPADLSAHVAHKLEAWAGGARALMLALSGGRDSIVLLELVRPWCAARGVRFGATHVHHGLSAHADAWAAFCAALCDRHAIDFELVRVTIDRSMSTSVEAAARAARYRALATAARRQGVDAVLLAQHADDQAETVLLQLARGAGPHGLAAMPERRVVDGVTWLRPLLDIPRASIDAHAHAHALEFVDDDSNASPRFRRNALRHALVPAMREIAPGYPGTLVRAAKLAAEAANLADDLAAIDARHAFDGATLARQRLRELPAHRARNLMRWFLRSAGLRAPSSARLGAMLAQLVEAAPDARVQLVHDGAQVGIHAGRVIVHPMAPAAFECAWRGEPSLALPHGTLNFTPAAGDGLLATTASSSRWSVRARRGGERLTLDAARPRRMLKSLLQEAGMPTWDRDALPLVFCDDALAAVPGVGVDVAFRTGAGAAGVAVCWVAQARR
ncbi:MAG: tRNA lysidine(34) synthetase TilS [Betaproteobacteria bacterium]